MKRILVALLFSFVSLTSAVAQELTLFPGDGNIPTDVVELNGVLYFVANNQELYATDAINQPQVVAEFNADPACFETTIDFTTGETIQVPRRPILEGLINGELLIRQDRSLYVSNGTQAGTRLFASRTDTCEFDVEIAGSHAYWIEGGILWATSEASPLVALTSSAIEIEQSYVVDDAYYFATSDNELWISEGTLGTTFPVASLTSSAPLRLVHADGTLFAIFSGAAGATLQAFDSGIGEFVEAEFFPGGEMQQHHLHKLAGDQLLFSVVTNGFASLYVFDAATDNLTNLAIGGDSLYQSNSSTFLKSGGLVYFISNDPNSPEQGLWATDGTQAGTLEVLRNTFIIEEAGTDLAAFSLQDGRIAFFLDADFFHGPELWISDGVNAARNSPFDQDVSPFSIFRGLGEQVLLAVSDANSLQSLASLVPVYDQSLADFVIAEDAPNESVVGIAAYRPELDLSAFDVSYSIFSGNVDNSFAIDSLTGKICVSNDAAIDYETATSFDLRIELTATQGEFQIRLLYQVVIEVTDVDEVIVPEVIITFVIDEIELLIDEGDLTQGQGNPIENFLTQALKSIDKGKTNKAVDKLIKAIERIENLVDDGALSAETGGDLILLIEAAIDEL